jgi:hypothetical protein
VVADRARQGCQLDVTISIAAFTFPASDVGGRRSNSFTLATVKLDVQSQPRITIQDDTPRK